MNILIIGASRGIGLEFVRQYAHAGSLTPPTQETFDAVMHANVLGAMQVIPQVAPLVEEASGKFAFISSEMGCITEVPSSSSWTYRVSKAALNMAVQSARFDYQKAHFMALSPGWVQTDMGGAGAPLTVEISVQQMRQTIAKTKSQDANVFWHPDGKHFKGW